MAHVGIRRITSFAILGILVFAAAPAHAALSGANNSNFTGFTCGGGGTGDGDCARSSGFTFNGANAFTSRYAWNVNADTAVFSTRDVSSNAQHNITFTANAVGGYRLDINTSRVGALGRSADASGCDGAADTIGISGSSNIALNSGTLSIGDPGSIGNGGGNSNVTISQASSPQATIFRVSNGVNQSHALTFTWSGNVRSNSCEASVRQGEGSGSTSGCAVCGYPGDPVRAQAGDGHFVSVTFTNLCGNGTIDGSVGEACDLGSANGAFGNCCSTSCTFRSSSTNCRTPNGPCDAAENCTGGSATCPADGFLPSSTVCRAASGVCDIAENCTGTGTGCPFDFLEGGFTTCRPSAGVCDPSELCTGSNPFCPADAKFGSTTVCRPTAGVCDVAETCNGVSNNCPGDGFASTSTVCRNSAGVCDLAENCTGTGTACPANGFQSSSTTCRPSADVCDVAENCSGSGAACPADSFDNSTVCRPAAGVCDVAETCNGSGAACPADSVSGAFVTCRPSTGVCDPGENCDGVNAGCPGDVLASTATVCRPSGGVCDVAENCDGVSGACPADALEPSSTVCRASAGSCDVAETCTGSGTSCPADTVLSSSTVCRPSGGICDLAENCNGSTGVCPADAKFAGVCRPSAGVCDVAESCDGVSDSCPGDSVAGAFVTCRPSAGVCDTAENCDGVGTACPADSTLPDGTACNDNSACTGPDECEAGVCTGDANAGACADHYSCYKTKGTAPTVPNVNLVDQFENITVSATKLRMLCAPSDKNSEGVFDNVTHLEAYLLRVNTGTPSFVRRTLVQVDNQFGTYFVDAYKRDLLLVPTNKSLVGPATPPNNSLINVDHYKCYKAKTTRGTAKFPATTVNLADQFQSPAKQVILKKIRHLCTPVNKNGEGIKNPEAHMVCYQAKSGKGQPKHVRTTVSTANQFGGLAFSTVKEREFCVPSLKTIAP